MTDNTTVWLEVLKSNGAVMSYYLQPPDASSSRFDYIEATEEELVYLNALERDVFALGTIATLSDLQDHRARVQVAKEKAVKTAVNAPQKAAEAASSPTPSIIHERRSASLKAAIKQHRNRK